VCKDCNAEAAVEEAATKKSIESCVIGSIKRRDTPKYGSSTISISEVSNDGNSVIDIESMTVAELMTDKT